MRRFGGGQWLFMLILNVLWLAPALAQERNGWITGTATDSTKGALAGARAELQPKGLSVASNAQGQFMISDVPPGRYTLTVSYMGFMPFTREVNVSGGQATHVDAILQVGSQSEVVTVRGERERGELEAINRERTADNIVQVLPADVITSLPNTNIADAVGRLPSVSLERDEGEGKYIQIRGTEPRLSNVTIDGIHVPSPEGVRNVKLDVIPADLVDSIEVNKTLSANQDADAIGGSVNLVTKSPADQPYLSVLGMGGFTPIEGGRTLNQITATLGNRFGEGKRFGILVGGSYDHNNRGIDDVEPAPTANSLPNGSIFFGPNTEDIRQYQYNRSRVGFTGDVDYRLADMSSIYLRGFFSRFHDYGEDWIYSPGISNFITSPATDPNNTCGLTTVNGPAGCGNMGFADVYRKPSQQIFSAQAGARHGLGTAVLNYEIALSQATSKAAYPRASFDGPGASSLSPADSVAFGVNSSDRFTPTFPVLNGVNIYDPSAYTLGRVSFQNDNTFERDVVGDVSLNKPYSMHSHYGSFELGFKGWDARKTQLFDESSFSPNNAVLMNQFLRNFSNHDYYFGRYTAGPITDYNKILAFFNNNAGAFSGGFEPDRSFPNDFDINERIWAGYAMNTISFGKLRLQTGVRIEATQDDLRGNVFCPTPDSTCPSSISPLLRNNSYTDVFPSVQAQYRLTSDTVLRAAYGMGIARPNFGDQAPFVIYDPNGSPSQPVTAGNADLKPTHAQNFDVLLERYLKPVGLIQAGAFYKYLTDPIYFVTSVRTVQPFAGLVQSAPINGPKAHITGIEMAWQQQLRFLPGALNGMGVRANYSYTTSRASFPVGFGRSDHPTLLRTAPNNWNFDVTYDKKGVSARMGLTHNDANLWSYGFQDGALGGIHGPLGDTYLYPHTQVDAQVSYWIPRGHGVQVVAAMLNLNNEVFGFYNGSEQFPIQREYYNRTYSFGLRWTLSPENR